MKPLMSGEAAFREARNWTQIPSRFLRPKHRFQMFNLLLLLKKAGLARFWLQINIPLEFHRISDFITCRFVANLPPKEFEMAYRLRATKTIPAIALTALTVLLVKTNLQTLQAEEVSKKPAAWIPPSRKDMISRLKSIKDNKLQEKPTVFDLLIIGGGATGVGCVS